MTDLLDEQQLAAFGETVARIAELAAAGRLTAAARAFAGFVCTDEEVAMLEDDGYLEAVGRCAPVMLNDIQQAPQSEGPTAADPAVLGRISAPILLLHGPDTVNSWFTTCVQHVADQTPNARVHEIPGAGHYAPLTHPEALAEALTEFFSPPQQPA